jgi:hypothetical protein
MSPRRSPAVVLLAALLVVPLFVVGLGQASLAHEEHGCLSEKDCLGCRWAADAVADVPSPLALPHSLAPIGRVESEPAETPTGFARTASTSRGPPLP